MTETELADRLDLSRNQLYNIKRGHSGTSHETIGRLVQAFGLIARGDIEQLYDLAGFKAPSPSFVEDGPAIGPDIYALLDALSPDDRADLLVLAETKWRRTHPNMPLPGRPIERLPLPALPSICVVFNPDTNAWFEMSGEEITDERRLRHFITVATQRPLVRKMDAQAEHATEAKIAR